MAINGREALNYFLKWARGDIVEYIVTWSYKRKIWWFSGLDERIVAYCIEKYLFYLIDYDFILYNGQKQVYVIKYRGIICDYGRK